MILMTMKPELLGKMDRHAYVSMNEVYDMEKERRSSNTQIDGEEPLLSNMALLQSMRCTACD